MNAIKPEIHFSVFGRKKKPTEEVATTEEVLAETVAAAKIVLSDTVEDTKAAVDFLAVKFLIGAAITGAFLIVVNTGGKILVNALDTRHN